MFCSIVIPTIGRLTLSRAVNSVLKQQLPVGSFEVIIVNDSGRPLPVESWQDSVNVQIINTNQRERSFARNTGAAVAKGKYIWFLDDDDWILPGALESFWLLSQESPYAVWLYGGIRIVDSFDNNLAEANSGLSGNCLAQIMGGAWVPIQSSIIHTQTFFEVGGYNPFICGTEDQDLCRRIAARGEFANCQAIMACLFRGDSWDTSTNYIRAPEDTRVSRDAVADEPGSFKRMVSSADSSYWFGRLFHVYSGLVIWHFRHKRLLTGFSRGVLAVLLIVYSGRYLIAPSFWRAFRDNHVPGTLHFIMRSLEQEHK